MGDETALELNNIFNVGEEMVLELLGILVMLSLSKTHETLLIGVETPALEFISFREIEVPHLLLVVRVSSLTVFLGFFKSVGLVKLFQIIKE